eukprot:COSAG02_NODE_410_length_22875_cov_43.282755_17_plen_537_part_00
MVHGVPGWLIPMSARVIVGLVCAMLLLAASAASQQLQPNPPVWPSTVRVFHPHEDTTIEQAVVAAYADNGGRLDHGQFSSDRYAFMFMPGSYSDNVPVGFYTQVLGLGTSPSDVVFTSDKGVHCEEGEYAFSTGALDTFWRSAENFETHADHMWTDQKGMLWAVSQAAPLRRVIVQNNLKLYQYHGGDAAGYGSGGFLADSVVKGSVSSGSQQQWLTRSSKVGGWKDGNWNMVFVGVEGAPQPHCGRDARLCRNPFVAVDRAPLVAEKPFISADPITGKFSLNIPAARRNSTGPDVSNGTWTPAPAVGFEQVYVADATKDTAATINAQLSAGLHVVLAPGIYMLEASLVISSHGQVLLGLGMATLIPTGGTPCVTVLDHITGVRVAGLLLQAGTTHSTTLLQWGSPSTPNGSPQRDAKPRFATPADADFGFLFDIFARVGGPALPVGEQASASSMIVIDSSAVIGDNMWLWRADHVEGGALVKNGDNPCDHGAIINGDDIIMYGLAAEHTLQDIVLWSGAHQTCQCVGSVLLLYRG